MMPFRLTLLNFLIHASSAARSRSCMEQSNYCVYRLDCLLVLGRISHRSHSVPWSYWVRVPRCAGSSDTSFHQKSSKTLTELGCLMCLRKCRSILLTLLLLSQDTLSWTGRVLHCWYHDSLSVTSWQSIQLAWRSYGSIAPPSPWWLAAPYYKILPAAVLLSGVDKLPSMQDSRVVLVSSVGTIVLASGAVGSELCKVERTPYCDDDDVNDWNFPVLPVGYQVDVSARHRRDLMLLAHFTLWPMLQYSRMQNEATVGCCKIWTLLKMQFCWGRQKISVRILDPFSAEKVVFQASRAENRNVVKKTEGRSRKEIRWAILELLDCAETFQRSDSLLTLHVTIPRVVTVMAGPLTG